MAMTFADLQTALQAHIDGVELDPAQLALWLNEAQNDLSLEFGPVKHKEYKASAGVGVMLPEDCVAVLDCSTEYTYKAGKILFADSGTVTIDYRAFALPFDGTNAAQVSELPASVHHLLPLFAASRYWLTEAEGDGEEMTQSNTYMQYYLAGKAQMLSRVRNLGGSRVDAWQVI